MIAKLHEIQNHTLLAICDNELLGKKIETEKIEFNVSERFYGGEEINEKDLLELFQNANSVNVIGNQSVEILQKKGLINESSIININNIKHVQIYKV